MVSNGADLARTVRHTALAESDLESYTIRLPDGGIQEGFSIALLLEAGLPTVSENCTLYKADS